MTLKISMFYTSKIPFLLVKLDCNNLKPTYSAALMQHFD